MEIKVHDLETNAEIEREMTAEEVAAYHKIQADIEAVKADAEAKEAARIAVLEKLGLSAEDIAALGL
jgi:hypothetical protein